MTSKGRILIRKTGPYTSIQDAGRFGYMEFGLGRSGAMDQQSAIIANRLVGNPVDAALLETTFQGLSLQFSDGCIVAITGGDLGARLNGRTVGSYKAVPVKPGDELAFTKRKTGFRAYVAISGGINSVKKMGSRSGHTLFDLGMEAIHEGSQLNFNVVKKKLHPYIIREGSIPVFSKHFTARILPGPEHHLFPDQLIERLGKESFKVSTDSNRMGYRLSDQLDDRDLPEGIVSSGIVPGTIQITSSGQPIVLMNDGPTTGGYARIGNIISPDLNHMAQLGPGDTLRFRWIDFEEADQLLADYHSMLKDIFV